MSTNYTSVRKCLRKNAEARKILKAIIKSHDEGLLTTRELGRLVSWAKRLEAK